MGAEIRDDLKGLGMDATHLKTFNIFSSNTTEQALYVCEDWYQTLQSQYERLQPELKASTTRIRLTFKS